MKAATVLKVVVAVALLAWMITDGRLDPSRLSIFADHPELSAVAIAYWLIGPVILATLRWRLLLRCAGYKLTVARSIRLQLVGTFFTTVMPGSLGGDFIKVFYLIRDNPDKDRSNALWAILFDRIIGMCGLFLIGAIFISINLTALWSITLLRPVILVVYGYLALFCAFLVLLKRMKSPAAPQSPGSQTAARSLLNRVYQFLTACRVYRDQFRAIFVSVVLSTVAHGLSFVLFAALAWGTWGQGGSLGELAAIFPVGMLVTTLPLSPGGLGVGHLAFDHLFMLVGLTDGANIYNAYFVCQTLLNLTGVLAYLGKGSGRAETVAIPAAG
jgi:glycosyltransferase 2 family protein